ncbi:YjcZ family sporulation protein [Paenibacillus sp. G2S3]|nr:YjcZ family sporulation protein [Paenibacillus sp. G2S3]WHY18173.1 YjcZ family sporulation protein [Paenibacillus sp. G2S3]
MSENVAGFGGGYGGGIGGAFTSTGAILVLFILLVIISKTILL